MVWWLDPLTAMLTAAILEWGRCGAFSYGFCQVFSYNIKHRLTDDQEKHFFVCCNNMDEKSCQGNTYQKPGRRESFCTGQVVKDTGSHWTQMEKDAFPDEGRFYCGGCCGQNLAAQACDNLLKESKWPGCMNWVQCFQNQCRNVVTALLSNEPLKCSLPPPPHPKHFIHPPRPVPANASASVLSAKQYQAHHPNFTCNKHGCLALSQETRCRMHCCQQYCCLPDGRIGNDRRAGMFGLSTLQVIGICIGTAAFLAALAALVLLLTRRCMPSCRNGMRPNMNDTQILVIEGPEDVDSDDPDSI